MRLLCHVEFMKTLNEGEIIELKAGHMVYVKLPAHFCYSNRKGCFDELAKRAVKIGEQIGGLDTNYLAGRYIVTKTANDGGGTGHGPHDVYPDGHHVWCESIGESWDTKIAVDFYQSGCFTAMNGEIPVIGKATKRLEAQVA